MQLRQRLRHQIIETLKDKTSAKDKVNVNAKAFGEPYPHIEVSTPHEECELASNSPAMTGHTLTLMVDAVAQAEAGEICDLVDELAEQIMHAIGPPGPVGDLAVDLLMNKIATDFLHDPELSLGFLRIEYIANYLRGDARVHGN